MKIFSFIAQRQSIGYESSIRDKHSLVKILLNVTKSLIIGNGVKNISEISDIANDNKPLGNDDVIVVVFIDKMSRCFIKDEYKIHTFNFPFHVCYQEGKISVTHSAGIDLDSKATSLMLSIFNEINEDPSTESLIDVFWKQIDEYQIIGDEREEYGKLAYFLITFEPGYLRYDKEKNSDKKLHPLHHLDFYYSRSNTLKIGLEHQTELSDFLDILDTQTECHYLK